MRSWMIALSLVASVVVGIPVIWYVGHGIVVTTRQRDLDERAQADLVSGLPAAELSVQRQRAQALKGRAVPQYSWTGVTCSLDTQDAGWIIEAYEQECHVTAVDLIVSSNPPGTCRDAWPGAGPAGSCDRLLEQVKYGVLLSGRRPAGADLGHGWLVLVSTAEASRTFLGCSPWDPIFCDSPLDEPVIDPEALTARR